MHEVVQVLRFVFDVPQGQFWLFVGLLLATIYGLLRRKHRQELFWTTAVVVVPPMIILPLIPSMIVSHSSLVNWIGLTASILYVMTGFVGFCIAWIPGVALGYLFGWAVERPEQNGAKT